MKNRFLTFGLASFLLLPTLVSLAGCGDSTATQVEDPKTAAARLDSGKKMREYFEKCQGNYDNLSPEDKTALNALSGSEANSKEAFSHMGKPASAAAPGAAPAPAGGLPPTGPGAH